MFDTKGKAVLYLVTSGGPDEDKKMVEDWSRAKGIEEKMRRMDRGQGAGFRSEKRRSEGGDSSMEKKRKVMVPDSSWLDGGDLLPAGWKMKGEPGMGNYRVLSSENLSFPALRHHLRHMLQNGFLDEQVEEVRSKMLLNGWQKDELLPRGWMYKPKTEKKPALYCTFEGELVQSHSRAMEKLKETDGEAVENFDAFMKKLGIGLRDLRMDLSDFKTSLYLPEGWLGNEKAQSVHNKHIHLVNKEHKRFSTYKSAAEFMEADARYSAQDVEMLMLYPDGKRHCNGSRNPQQNTLPNTLPNTQRNSPQIPMQNQLRTPLQNRVQIPLQNRLQNPRQNIPTQNQVGAVKPENDWQESDYLPDGWTCKQQNKAAGILLKSPEGKICTSYSTAEALLKEDTTRYGKQDIIRLYMYPDGGNHRTLVAPKPGPPVRGASKVLQQGVRQEVSALQRLDRGAISWQKVQKEVKEGVPQGEGNKKTVLQFTDIGDVMAKLRAPK